MNYALSVITKEEPSEDSISELLSHYRLKDEWDNETRLDGWCIGGIYTGNLRTKEGNEVDFARISEIDFRNEMSVQEYIEKNPSIVDKYNDSIKNGDGLNSIYFLKKRYPTLESYVIHWKIWATFALLDENGVWHEREGSSIDDEIEWESNFYDTFIKGKDNYWLTLVACHR